MSYFSNGTEYEAWSAAWCDRCEVDHDDLHGGRSDGPGCILVALAMCDEEVPQWIDNTPTDGFTFPPPISCMDFRRCACDGGHNDPPGEPRPPKPDPNQTVLFDGDALAPGVPRGVFLDEIEKVDA